MTIRGKRYSRISGFTDFSRRLRFCMSVEQPLEGRGAPKAEDRSAPQGQPSTRRDERGCEIARLPESSSKAEPRDLNVIAAFCIGEETQKSFCLIVISQSTFYRCARKISRFARNDDTGQPSARRDERGCEIARLLGSSSKAEPRDLNMIAAFCIGEETQSFFAVSLSHSLRFTGGWARKISRFARNDDMGGKRRYGECWDAEERYSHFPTHAG